MPHPPTHSAMDSWIAQIETFLKDPYNGHICIGRVPTSKVKDLAALVLRPRGLTMQSEAVVKTIDVGASGGLAHVFKPPVAYLVTLIEALQDVFSRPELSGGSVRVPVPIRTQQGQPTVEEKRATLMAALVPVFRSVGLSCRDCGVERVFIHLNILTVFVQLLPGHSLAAPSGTVNLVEPLTRAFTSPVHLAVPPPSLKPQELSAAAASASPLFSAPLPLPAPTALLALPPPTASIASPDDPTVVRQWTGGEGSSHPPSGVKNPLSMPPPPRASWPEQPWWITTQGGILESPPPSSLRVVERPPAATAPVVNAMEPVPAALTKVIINFCKQNAFRLSHFYQTFDVRHYLIAGDDGGRGQPASFPGDYYATYVAPNLDVNVASTWVAEADKTGSTLTLWKTVDGRMRDISVAIATVRSQAKKGQRSHASISHFLVTPNGPSRGSGAQLLKKIKQFIDREHTGAVKAYCRPSTPADISCAKGQFPPGILNVVTLVAKELPRGRVSTVAMSASKESSVNTAGEKGGSSVPSGQALQTFLAQLQLSPAALYSQLVKQQSALPHGWSFRFGNHHGSSSADSHGNRGGLSEGGGWLLNHVTRDAYPVAEGEAVLDGLRTAFHRGLHDVQAHYGAAVAPIEQQDRSGNNADGVAETRLHGVQATVAASAGEGTGAKGGGDDRRAAGEEEGEDVGEDLEAMAELDDGGPALAPVERPTTSPIQAVPQHGGTCQSADDAVTRLTPTNTGEPGQVPNDGTRRSPDHATQRTPSFDSVVTSTETSVASCVSTAAAVPSEGSAAVVGPVSAPLPTSDGGGNSPLDTMVVEETSVVAETSS